MSIVKPCKICNSRAEYHDYDIKEDKQAINCTRCGKYYLMNSFETDIYNDESNFYKVSSWVREQNDEWNKVPELDHEKFEQILNMKDKKIKEKFNLLIQYLSKLEYGQVIDYDVFTKCWIKDYMEFDSIFDKALRLEYIELDSPMKDDDFPYYKSLTFDGLQYIEDLEQPNKNSKKIFAAFNFEEPLTDIFKVYLKEAIEKEGFELVVVDQNSVDHNKAINDEIIVKLKTSRVVIADVTNHRPSVYFEAGFAMGMNIPVIWTCREDHKDDMPFDTRQFPHIVWKDKDDLVKQVITRIKRII